MNKSIQNAVLGYTAKESSQDRLPAGNHVVSIVDWRVLHSRIEWNGDPKAKLPEFSDSTPQLGVMFRGKEGIAFHRFNIWGFARFDELTDEQQGSDKFAKVVFGETVYACKVQGDGQLVRIRDKKRCADAESIIDQFMASVGKTGVSIGDAMADLVASEHELTITVEDDEYNGKDQLKVTRFNKAVATVEADGEFGE